VTYYYAVSSRDTALNWNDTVTGGQNADTGISLVTPDTTPPVISNVLGVPSDTGATITWDTDEAATSRVDYGTTTAYGGFVESATLVTSHTGALGGLMPGTEYHYKVTSADGSGNSASSQDLTFTTTIAGPQAYYAFDEGSGTIANDSSGNGNNGTINDAAWATGKNSGALSFNGTNSYVSLSKILPSLSEFTASAWVNVNNLTAIRGIFSSGGRNGNGFRFRININGSVWMLMAGGGTFDTLFTSAGVIQTGVFYHISVTGKSGQYMRIYVNGVLVREKTTTQTVGAPTAVGYIGTSWNTSSELMNGTIDDVRIYDRVLSSQEVLDTYRR
jgi:hypothetical protein